MQLQRLCSRVALLSGLLADLFHIVATHMVFTDLTMVFFGVPTPLEHLREPLQQFVHENVLNGNPATEANIDSAVDRLMRDIQPDIDAVGVSTPVSWSTHYTYCKPIDNLTVMTN